MRELTAFITAVFFLLGSGLFLPDVKAEPKSPLVGKMLADHKDKKKLSHEEKEEMLKKKEEELSQREEALNKKEEQLKAWEQRLKKRSRIRRVTPTTTTPGVVNPQAPRTSGTVTPGTPSTPGATPTRTYR